MARFLVTRAPGPNWDHAKTTREQAAWDPHAAFMDALADDGFVVYGGPAGNRGEAVHVVNGPDEQTIEARLALDPWTSAGVLRTAAIESWATWLGGDDRLDPSRPLYLVGYGPGPNWDPTKPRREQEGWDTHARFMDALDEGVVIVGGPLDERRAMLVMRDDDEQSLRSRIDEDPWVGDVLTVERVEQWSLWLPPRPHRR